jgi:cytochrome c-type biogenesis protein CcsB
MLVSVNQSMATLSGDFLIAALLIYSASVIAFAGDFAFGRPRRTAARAVTPADAAIKERELATVGGGALAGRADRERVIDVLKTAFAEERLPQGELDGRVERALAARTHEDLTALTADLLAPAVVAPPAPPQTPRLGSLAAIGAAGGWVRAGVVLSALGAAAHLVAVVARGLAVHRAPWGNMYEFVTALTCVAVLFFLYVLIRYRAWSLGVFVMGAVVFALGLAETVIYTAAGPLVPALQSYWLSIHVTAMTLATGIFFVAAVLGAMYLISERYRVRGAGKGSAAGQGSGAGGNGLIARIPSADQLDKLTYRTVIFGFPVWTFGVIAGAIWADQAWGRYWGWDPVETWAFITWVLYACYLHARATAGWRGRRAHYIQLIGFASLVTNMLVVQVFITGMHSYAGVS